MGVLLWEISSGKTPFEDCNDYTILTTILSGNRGERILDTPDEYYKSYSECWDDETEKRHTVENVYEVLEKLLNDNDDYDEKNLLENEDKM